MSVARRACFVAAALLLAACTSPQPASTLRVLTWNIHHGRGLDGAVDLDRIAAVIRSAAPDLVALQEVDAGTQRTAGIDIAAELGARCGMEPVFGRNLDYQGGGYGNAVLSALPIAWHDNVHYRMLRQGEQRGVLRVGVWHGAHEIVLLDTHLDYRPDDLERLSNLREVAAMCGAWPTAVVVLCGDLNAEPGSATWRAATRGFDDCWEVVGEGEGFTYPAGEPRKRIDYVLVRRGADVRVRTARVLASEASDHLPLVVELELGG